MRRFFRTTLLVLSVPFILFGALAIPIAWLTQAPFTTARPPWIQISATLALFGGLIELLVALALDCPW